MRPYVAFLTNLYKLDASVVIDTVELSRIINWPTAFYENYLISWKNSQQKSNLRDWSLEPVSADSLKTTWSNISEVNSE